MKDVSNLNALYLPNYSISQLTILVILRILIGWHFLYEGLVKIFDPYWTSAGYLLETKWIFSETFLLIVSNPILLEIADFLNEWGLAAIGLGLILGLFTRTASAAGIILLFLYYIATPPLTGLKYSIPSEGNYLIVNKTLIELFALMVINIFPTGSIIGLDKFFFRKFIYEESSELLKG